MKGQGKSRLKLDPSLFNLELFFGCTQKYVGTYCICLSNYITPNTSASTCPLTLAYLYDVQSNGVMSNIDSRLAERNGFMVDLLCPHGMSVRDNDRTNLSEGLDSPQAALNLAGAQPYVTFDLFLTFTCNQKCHPGVKYLHEWKESMEWSSYIPSYSCMTIMQHNKIKRSFELAY